MKQAVKKVRAPKKIEVQAFLEYLKEMKHPQTEEIENQVGLFIKK